MPFVEKNTLTFLTLLR